jgi:uncharacterized membrane protein YgcG
LPLLKIVQKLMNLKEFDFEEKKKKKKKKLEKVKMSDVSSTHERAERLRAQLRERRRERELVLAQAQQKQAQKQSQLAKVENEIESENDTNAVNNNGNGTLSASPLVANVNRRTHTMSELDAPLSYRKSTLIAQQDLIQIVPVVDSSRKSEQQNKGRAAAVAVVKKRTNATPPAPSVVQVDDNVVDHRQKVTGEQQVEVAEVVVLKNESRRLDDEERDVIEQIVRIKNRLIELNRKIDAERQLVEKRRLERRDKRQQMAQRQAEDARLEEARLLELAQRRAERRRERRRWRQQAVRQHEQHQRQRRQHDGVAADLCCDDCVLIDASGRASDGSDGELGSDSYDFEDEEEDDVALEDWEEVVEGQDVFDLREERITEVVKHKEDVSAQLREHEIAALRDPAAVTMSVESAVAHGLIDAKHAARAAARPVKLDAEGRLAYLRDVFVRRQLRACFRKHLESIGARVLLDFLEQLDTLHKLADGDRAVFVVRFVQVWKQHASKVGKLVAKSSGGSALLFAEKPPHDAIDVDVLRSLQLAIVHIIDGTFMDSFLRSSAFHSYSRRQRQRKPRLVRLRRHDDARRPSTIATSSGGVSGGGGHGSGHSASLSSLVSGGSESGGGMSASSLSPKSALARVAANSSSGSDDNDDGDDDDRARNDMRRRNKRIDTEQQHPAWRQLAPAVSMTLDDVRDLCEEDSSSPSSSPLVSPRAMSPPRAVSPPPATRRRRSSAEFVSSAPVDEESFTMSLTVGKPSSAPPLDELLATQSPQQRPRFKPTRFNATLEDDSDTCTSASSDDDSEFRNDDDAVDAPFSKRSAGGAANISWSFLPK